MPSIASAQILMNDISLAPMFSVSFIRVHEGCVIILCEITGACSEHSIIDLLSII